MDKAKVIELKESKNVMKEKMKGKEFKNLSTKEKDELLEMVCKLLNLI